MRSTGSAPRGFTLLELMAGAAVSVIILSAVAASFIGINGAYQSETVIKTAVENGRAATSFLERTVTLAGYGIEPRFAFDFTAAGLPGNTKDNYDGATFVTDDLAFRYRDPQFLRRGRVDGGGNMTLSGAKPTFDQAFRAGQAFLAACEGAREYVVVRLQAPVVAGDNTASVAVDPALGDAAIPPCLDSGDQYLMLVREYRIRVENGYLMLVDSLDVNAAQRVPIASNVESFQVSYVMNRGAAGAPDAAGNANWILGDAPGDVLPNPAAVAPGYDTTYDHADRFTTHPANIRAVRVGLVLRSSTPLRQDRNGAFPAIALENDNKAWPATDAFYRTSMVTVIRTPNTLSRSFFLPPLAGDTTTNLNAWGG